MCNWRDNKTSHPTKNVDQPYQNSTSHKPSSDIYRNVSGNIHLRLDIRPLSTIQFRIMMMKPDNLLILLTYYFVDYSLLRWLLCCVLNSNQNITSSNSQLVTPPTQLSGCPSQTSTVPNSTECSPRRCITVVEYADSTQLSVYLTVQSRIQHYPVPAR